MIMIGKTSFVIMERKKEEHGVGGEDHCKGARMDGRERAG